MAATTCQVRETPTDFLQAASTLISIGFAGVVGLNNIKTTDWVNVTVQSLIRVPSLRNFFLAEKNYIAVLPFALLRGLILIWF